MVLLQEIGRAFKANSIILLATPLLIVTLYYLDRYYQAGGELFFKALGSLILGVGLWYSEFIRSLAMIVVGIAIFYFGWRALLYVFGAIGNAIVL